MREEKSVDLLGLMLAIQPPMVVASCGELNPSGSTLYFRKRRIWEGNHRMGPWRSVLARNSRQVVAGICFAAPKTALVLASGAGALLATFRMIRFAGDLIMTLPDEPACQD